jgi:trk system potassium uptake protein
MLKAFREKVNITIYDSKSRVLRVFRTLYLLVSIASLCSIIYYYGFPQTDESKDFLVSILHFSFGFYVFHFLVQFVYDFEPRKLLKEQWFKVSVLSLLVIEAVSYNFFNTLFITSIFERIGFVNFGHYSNLLIQIYFLIVIVAEISKSGSYIPRFKIHPSYLFMLTFLLLIFSGTILLMLPEMTIQEGSMRFIDALFTSTTASSVTGIVVVDTATFFTIKGQIVLLFLIKLGGLNIIAFGTFVVLASRMGIGVKHHEVIEDFINKDSLVSAKGLLGKILIATLFIELFGALLLYFSWPDEMSFSHSVGDRIYYSIFHSISAFNSAGISIIPDGMYSSALSNSFMTHWVVMVLFFLGALGFHAIYDLFSLKRLRERLKFPWKQVNFSTKIVLYFTLVLLLLGVVVFLLFESSNEMKDMSVFEKISHALFQSASTRSAGFNSLDIGRLTYPTLIIFLILMFIGGASGSTAGGIKTSTFALLYASTLATLKGRKDAVLFRRTISNNHLFRAYSVFVYFCLGVSLGIFLLTITEEDIIEKYGVFQVIFEQFSAFCNVGLSMGITESLSSAGKVIIIVSMFIGRVGTLTIAYVLVKPSEDSKILYPKGETMVG